MLIRMGLSVCAIAIIYLYNIVEYINVPKGSRQSVFSNMQTSVVALYYEFHSWSRVTSKTQTTPHAWRIPCVFFPSLFLSLFLSMCFLLLFSFVIRILFTSLTGNAFGASSLHVCSTVIIHAHLSNESTHCNLLLR